MSGTFTEGEELSRLADSSVAIGGPSSNGVELQSQLAQQTKVQIRQIVQEISELSRSDLSREAYQAGFLSRLVSALGGKSAAIWYRKNSDWVCQAEYQLPDTLSKSEHHLVHCKLLDRVMAEGQPVLIPPGSVKLETDRPANPTELLLIVVPLSAEACGSPAVVEVYQRPSGGPATQRGYLRFAAQMVDLANDFHKTLRLRELQRNQLQAESLQRFLPKLYQEKSFKHRSQRIADYLSPWLHAEQVAVMRRVPGGVWHAEAISNLPEVDPRSEGTVVLEDFVQAIAKDRGVSSLWIDAGQPTAPNEKPYAAFLDLFGVASALWIPIAAGSSNTLQANQPGNQDQPDPGSSSSVLAGLLIHWSHEAIDRERRITTEELLQPLLAAIWNALADAPIEPAWNKWLPIALSTTTIASQTRSDWNRRRWIQRGIASICLAAICVVPMPQRIVGNGWLQPVVQQRYYAPADAFVAEVPIEEGQMVKPGDILVRLEDRTLQLEIESVLGQQIELRNRLTQVESSLLRERDLQSIDQEKLAGEAAILGQNLAAIDERLKILKQRESDLVIRATAAGTVATWEAKKRLANRPVRLGQMLVSVQDPQSDWQIEAEIPVRQLGRLGEAPLIGASSRIALLSHPTEVVAGKVVRADVQAYQNSTNESVIRVVSQIDSSKLPALRDGAATAVQIDAGSTPLVWWVTGDFFRSIWSSIRIWI